MNIVVKAVVFDIGGVLEIVPDMDFDRQWEARLGLPDGEVNRRLADVWLGGSIGTITENAVHQAIQDRLGVSRELADTLLAGMWEQYLGVGNDELIAFVRELGPRWRTGILSNSFVGAREREQDRYGFTDLVDAVVYSHETGMSKPDPRIYRLTATRLGVQPDEMVFVDDVEPNIAAARSAGINAIHFRDNAQAIAEIETALS